MYEKAAAAKPFERYADTGYAANWRKFNQSVVAQEKNAKRASMVTRAVIHAIEAPRPRRRYPLDGSWYVGRHLPDWVFDKIIFKAIGFD